MLPYILFWIILLILLFGVKYPRNVLPIAILMSAFTGFRVGIGSDFAMYQSMIDNYGFKELRDCEFLQLVLIGFAHNTIPQLFFVINAFFAISIVIYCIHHFSKKDGQFAVRVLFFAAYPQFYIQTFNIVRQYTAMAIILIAICFFMSNKKIQIVLILFAYLCHYSSIVGVLILFPWEKIKIKYFWVMLITSFVMGEFLPNIILSIKTSFIPLTKLQTYLLSEDLLTRGGNTYLKILLYIFVVLTLINYNNIIKHSTNYALYIRLVVVGASIHAIMAIAPHTAFRTCLYFFMLSTAFFPYVLKLLRNKSLIAIGAISLFFVYLNILHNSDIKSKSKDTSLWIPYISIFDK